LVCLGSRPPLQCAHRFGVGFFGRRHVDNLEPETIGSKKIHRVPAVRSAIRKFPGTVQYLSAELLHQLVDLVYLLAFLDVKSEVMQADFVDFERVPCEFGLCSKILTATPRKPGRTLTVSRCPLRSRIT